MLTSFLNLFYIKRTFFNPSSTVSLILCFQFMIFVLFLDSSNLWVALYHDFISISISLYNRPYPILINIFLLSTTNIYIYFKNWMTSPVRKMPIDGNVFKFFSAAVYMIYKYSYTSNSILKFNSAVYR